MPIRRIEQFVNDETDEQLTVLTNVEDENDKQFHGVGVVEMEVPGGGKMQKPVQFPFSDPDVKTIEQAWDQFKQNMTAYMTKVEEQYEEASKVVGPDGAPVTDEIPPPPKQFPGN